MGLQELTEPCIKVHAELDKAAQGCWDRVPKST